MRTICAMLPGMRRSARGSLRPRHLMSFIEHQPEPVSMGDRQPGLSQPRVYDRFSALTVWCNQGILRLVVQVGEVEPFLLRALLHPGEAIVGVLPCVVGVDGDELHAAGGVVGL